MTEIEYLKGTNERLVQTNRELQKKNREYIRLICLLTIFFVAVYAVLVLALVRSEKKVDRLSEELETKEIINADLYAGLRKVASELALTEQRADELSAELEELCGDGWYKLEDCTLTAYCCEAYPHICGEGHGITKSGMPVQPGVVAVDPSVIPLGSIVIIGGVAYVAADTGGAIEGKHIDIAVETHGEALEFGIQTQDVWVVVNK